MTSKEQLPLFFIPVLTTQVNITDLPEHGSILFRVFTLAHKINTHQSQYTHNSFSGASPV